MKALTVFFALCVLLGCNMNPNKEARISTLEEEVKLLSTQLQVMESKVDSLNTALMQAKAIPVVEAANQ